MNNKGQSLVIFVVFLPLFIISIATVVDTGLMYMSSNQLNNLNKLSIKYGLDNLNKDDLENSIIDLINKNNSNIDKDNIKIFIDDNIIKISLCENLNSIFGRIIGFDKYKIKSEYTGTIKEDKKEIKKG